MDARLDVSQGAARKQRRRRQQQDDVAAARALPAEQARHCSIDVG